MDYCEAGRARPTQGVQRRVLSPEAAALCQAGRVVSDAAPAVCLGGRAATQPCLFYATTD